jgi:4'-phosphopantetheinyl transferase
MSHSDDLVLYAVSRTCDVGVDVERVRAGVADEIINHFVPDAAQYLGMLSPAARQRDFYQGWTRMEAYLKGRGTGLRSSLEGLAAFIGKWPAHEWSRDGSGEVGYWSLLDLTPRAGYVGALVVDHVDCRLRFWRWQVEAHVPIGFRDSDVSIDNSYQTGP